VGRLENVISRIADTAYAVIVPFARPTKMESVWAEHTEVTAKRTETINNFIGSPVSIDDLHGQKHAA